MYGAEIQRRLVEVELALDGYWRTHQCEVFKRVDLWNGEQIPKL